MGNSQSRNRSNMLLDYWNNNHHHLPRAMYRELHEKAVLYFICREWNDDHVTDLVRVAAKTRALTLKQLRLGEKGTQALAALVLGYVGQSCCRLKQLELQIGHYGSSDPSSSEETPYHWEHGSVLFQALAAPSCTIESFALTVSEGQIGGGLMDLCNILKTSKSLTRLELTRMPPSQWSDSPVVMKSLGDALCINRTTLLRLDMTDCRLKDQAAIQLARVLRVHKTLRELDLRYNDISDVGAVALAEALLHNTSLQELHLGHNRIGTRGAVALADASLCRLDLQENLVDDTGALLQSLYANTRLEYICLNSFFTRSSPGVAAQIDFLVGNLHRHLQQAHFNHSHIPLALWPRILERINRIPDSGNVELLWCYLFRASQLIFDSR